VLSDRDYRAVFDASPDAMRMIRGLLPPELDHQGLCSALRSVFRDIREVYGFAVHARLDRVGGDLDAVAALALYRIVQEAVTNAVRHSQVHEATVTLSKQDDLVVAVISDEGRGFEFDGHHGLISMQERATIVGGALTVCSTPGRGTTVRAAVPVVDREPEP